MIRKASAVWSGSLKEGSGVVSSASGVLKDTAYSFTSRFEDGAATNPEELIAAAHAACYSMALSAFLGGAEVTPESVSTQADLSLENLDGAWTITKVHLTTRVKASGIDAGKFAEIAADAKAKCPVSRVLNAEITLDAQLI